MGRVRAGIKYYVVDAFADAPLKGNAAAVIVLDEEREETWMQSVAREFNISATCFLTKISSTTAVVDNVTNIHVQNGHVGEDNPRFRIRWFAPHAELNICGHGTLASSFVLFSTGIVNHNKIEFVSHIAGVVTATRVNNDKSHKLNGGGDSYVGGGISYLKQQQQEAADFSVKLGFPLIPTLELDSSELEFVPKSLIGCPSTPNVVSKMSFGGDLLVELSSGILVEDLQPALDEFKKWPGRGIIVTGPAPPATDFDFYSRAFFPNSGIPEDPVCGSVHCSLAPYWSKKLGKSDMKAYMASSRGGVLDLQVAEDTNTVFIAGKAALSMEGLLFA